PAVLHVLEPADGLGEGFLMKWVEGETLGARIARHEDFAGVRPRLARQCGEILARIHAIDVAASGLDQVLETLDPAAFIRRQWENYQAFDTPQPMIDYVARWLLDNRPPARPLTLVHNDFRNGNLMVDPDDGVVAVLDWELAHIGDPVRDLGWLCINSWRFGVPEREVGGFGSLEDLLDGYAAVSGERIDPAHVRYWEVFGSYWWAIGCLHMAEHYRTGPDRSVERPAIGRRSSECQVDCVNLVIPGEVAVPAPFDPGDRNMPRTGELLESVRDFLRGEIAEATAGRLSFLSRVAANSLDIVAREQTLGVVADAAERDRLAALLDADGELGELRQKLCDALRAGDFALDDARLTEHLRASVVARVAIDQPKYSGLAHALRASDDN
ncbi:MAG: phosphotransferase family protein, partial [Gammaproteobacteria bacterium]